MIITERFIFIHMHKTGGQTLSDVILNCIQDNRFIGYHFPRSEVPAEFSKLPIVGLVRNPWSWYVSWYSFNRRPNNHNPLFKVISDGRPEDFTSTVRNLVNLGSDEELSRRQRDRLASILPDTLDFNSGVGLTRHDISGFSDNGVGYYSWLFDRMIGIDHDDRTLIGNFENLQHDFLKIVEQLGVAEADALDKALDRGERKNSSRHSHYSHYYDDELRQLIASKEQHLIERFGYRFETVGPAEQPADSKTDPDSDDHQGFRKLLGRANNFLLVNRDFDTRPLREKVMQITDDAWAESDRSERYEVHRQTETVMLIKFLGGISIKPEIQPLYAEFEEQLQPVLDHIARYYQDNGFVLRILLAKLTAGGKIDEHVDSGYSLLNVHRIHIPIITNEDVDFYVGGTRKQMLAGEFWEIDNVQKHAVENNGDEDRVHMIVDWMPNHAGLDVEAAINAVKSTETAPESQDIVSLDDLIDKAYEYQRAGNTHRAQAGYRYVLDIDPDHAVCNNLMGMLYRQLRRYDEAIPFIEAAIAAEPNDAKAHSNLGQALLLQGKFVDSVTSFQNALSLSPNLETARVGLQRAQLELNGQTNTTTG